MRPCGPNSEISSAWLSRRCAVEPLLHAPGVDVRELVGEGHRARGVLAHAQVERRPRQVQRIVEPLLHLHREPAVDAAVDELERGHVDDEQRGDHQRAEDADGARGEARAGNVRAVIAHQAPQLVRQQPGEGDDPAHVDAEDPQLQPAELRGVLHALGEQQEGAPADGAPQQHLADGDPAEPTRLAWLLHTGSVQVYHSLTRAQSSVQKRKARMAEGRLPRRTPARTLMV